MNKIKNFIAQIIAKTNLKWVLIFLIVGGLFIGKTYAAEQTPLDNISFFMHLILSIASWGWIILANLAGKLMTNDVVYGAFLHIDSSLWTLRNIMKNFANFTLGFLVLFSIVKNIFSIGDSDAGKWKPLTIIKNTLIAGVLIQMSWFLMGAVIDISTIMTAAVGGFPSQFIESDDGFKSTINKNLSSLHKGTVKFNPANSQELVTWEEGDSLLEEGNEGDSYNKILDTIMPSYDSVSGPLIFLGLSVFELNDIGSYNGASGSQSASEWGELFMQLGLSSIILLSFSIMMFIIFVFNLFRVIMLWLIIPLLPIIIILKVFDILPSGDSYSFLKIKTILNLVFKPVIMVGALSMVLIVLVLIKSVVADDKVGTVSLGDHSNAVIESVKEGENIYSSTIKTDGLMEFTLKGKDTIADIIVYFFGLFLIFFLVKISVQTKTGVGFIDNSLDKMFNLVSDTFQSLPIIPIGTGVSVKAISEGNADLAGNLGSQLGIDVDSQIGNLPDFMQESSSVRENKLDKFAIGLIEAHPNSDFDKFYESKDVKLKIESWNDSNPNNKITEPSLEVYHEKYSKEVKNKEE